MEVKRIGVSLRWLSLYPIAPLMVAMGLQGCSELRKQIPSLADPNAPIQGMDPNTREIVDSKEVVFVDGLLVYGVGSTFGRFSPCGYGNLTGKPKPGKFEGLVIGLTMEEAIARAGYPDAQHVGLARRQGFSLSKVDVREDYRLEMAYAGLGRLVFAYVSPDYVQLQLGAVRPPIPAQCPGLRLKWIIYSENEPAGALERDNAHLTSYDGPPPEALGPAAAPGMNEFGQVIEPCQLERGKGQSVTMPGQFEGEISGKAVAGSAFNLLRIGMTQEKVLDVLGPPNGMSACGRSIYDGLGELAYAQSKAGASRLSWIIHAANDRAKR